MSTDPNVLQKLWNEMPWYAKLGLPLVIVLLFFRSGRDFVSRWLEERTRTKVDEKLRDQDQRIDELKREDANSAGRIEQLERERDEAVERVDDTDTVDFHNSRKPRSDR